jgi:small conductance mechanosensitive channel
METREMDCSKRLALAAMLLMLGGAPATRAQIPGLPGAPKAAADPAKGEKKAATKDTTVATASGPIAVEKKVRDDEIKTTLQELLPKFPGVRTVAVHVRNGIVTLDGHLDDDDTLDDVTQFTARVEGVRLVLNRMKTDEEVMTARQLAAKMLGEIEGVVAQKWLLALIALALALGSFALARAFNSYSEMLLAPFIRNVMVRSVVGSLLSTLLIAGGLMLGLGVLHLTHAVVSILGLAGVITLAVGFAFRDIAENFIASILLGVRRPFQIGDYITVAGQAGVVKTLNTRATVLVTLEGNHVRIPNNIIYKEIMVNASASSSTRGSFDVVVPNEASTAAALEAMNWVLREQDGILADPPARALVEALEAGGVRLRAYYWMPSRGVDQMKLQGDLKLKVKVALQQAAAIPTAAAPPVSAAQAEANLRHDTRAAERASPVADGRQTPIEHALEQAESRVSDEGENLLADGKGRNGTA